MGIDILIFQFVKEARLSTFEHTIVCASPLQYDNRTKFSDKNVCLQSNNVSYCLFIFQTL